MRTLRQKVDVELEDARVGGEWMGVKNAYFSSESASKIATLEQKRMLWTQRTSARAVLRAGEALSLWIYIKLTYPAPPY